MKKLVTALMLLSLILAFAACGDDNPIPTQPAATQGQLATKPGETVPPTVPTEPTTIPTEPPHVHEWVDATCTAPKTCSTCGATEGQPIDHRWDEGKVTVEATEEADGEMLHTCTACGETKTVVIPSLEHTHAYEAVTTSPTCTEAGYTTYTCRCGDSYVSNEVAAQGHSWADATCTAPKTCKSCGVTDGATVDHSWADATCTAPKTCKTCKVTDGVALGHDWAEATCISPKACSRCGKTEGALGGHNWTEATCTTVSTCTVCNSTIGAPLGHSWRAATCTDPKTCGRCGATEGETGEHDWIAATCTAPKTCGHCGATEGVAQGHNWFGANCFVGNTCSNCGATDGNVKGHDWKEADCDRPKTCKVCNTTEGSALGHDWVDATCTAPRTCATCGQTSGVAKGHDWEYATCTTPDTCRNCGATDRPAKGHAWKAANCSEPKTCTICGTTEGTAREHGWIEPTCTSPGYCKYCGTEGSPATGHRWLEATCSRPRRCEACFQEEGEPLGCEYVFIGCETWMQCSRCGGYGAYTPHDWDDDRKCTVCTQTSCEVYGHRYFYNRCYGCDAFDEEATALAKSLLAQIITSDMSEYEKVKTIHDHIVNNTQYDYDNYLNNTIPDVSFSPLGVLKHGVAVCQGYAYAFELLCDLSGIECDYVTGTGNGGGHGWNQVKVDGKWYNIDVTWDDPIYYVNGVRTPFLSYDYFLISDDVMYQDHVAEDAMHICPESYPVS